MRRQSTLPLWLLIGIAAYAGIAAVGVQTARQANEMRHLFQLLSAHQRVQDEHIREYRLLLLERATAAGYHNVERIAEEQLDMRFPDAVVRVDR